MIFYWYKMAIIHLHQYRGDKGLGVVQWDNPL